MSSKNRAQASKSNEQEAEEEKQGCNIFGLFTSRAHISNKAINKPIVWVLGGPGSGSSTQCGKITAKYGFTLLSTGDLLRAEAKKGSERGKNLTDIIEKGELAPNEVVIELLREAIMKNLESKGFLIDGYPREKDQGSAFEKNIGPCSVILYFEAKPETLKQRLLSAAGSGQTEDKEDKIQLRLQTFAEHNDQVLAQYSDKMRRINADRSVDEIFAEVETILDPLVATYA